MSHPENFLSRWSRRKCEVLRGTETVIRPPEEAVDKPAEKGRSSAERSAPSASASTPSTFDPASLPSIESITAETDIRGFLASGVPSELSQAALRRAWLCDPAIRNFVGLADYDWDFNAADSKAGFGPLPIADEVANMAARVLEPGRSEPGACNLVYPAPTIPNNEEMTDKGLAGAAHGAPAGMHNPAKDADEPITDEPITDERINEIGAPLHSDELMHRERGRAAVQYTSIKPEKRNVLVRRRHGGALPK